MSIDKDVKQFVDTIGATELSLESEVYREWKAVFRRSNYFVFNGKFMIVKISRSKPLFWGIGKKFIDLLNTQNDYLLVLLSSPLSGWVFSKDEVNLHIKNKRWNLRVADNNYKINYPLPDRNSFFSPDHLLKKLGIPRD